MKKEYNNSVDKVNRRYRMTRAECFEQEINHIDKEIRKFEQLNMTNDRYYCLLQMERATKICEMQYCIENNL